MTLYDFNAMGHAAKAVVLWEDGTLLAIRQEPAFFISLYQLDGFYVEAFYHAKRKLVTDYKAFASPERLQPYLDQIALPQFSTL